MKASRAAAMAALSAALLLLSILVSIQLPPAPMGEKVASTQTVAPLGKLSVIVLLNNGSALALPYQSVLVDVTQLLFFHGIHLYATTNRSGEAEFGLPPDSYGVTVGNGKFNLTTPVQVNQGQTTKLQVDVNRRSYDASFASASDSTTQGFIEPWDTLVVELRPYGSYAIPSLLGLGGLVVVPAQGGNLTVEKFGPVVFVQPVVYYAVGGGFVPRGGEVPASVIAQETGTNDSWLTLQPTKLLRVSGAMDIAVVSYSAASSVSFANG